ncbi:GDYXXLXY domain-containing protein [Caldimonas tepidiphila]|uniref:GDYXXLXY domain-containing protein n=1 Tax=Caldimonas tepidiphila TaxID=2315841 RepID=UPI0014740ADB|nr:GDYXXLXY domain-containing protein [Caldimonas tepidiphila]
MSRADGPSLLEQAVRQGLLPEGAAAPAPPGHPWPVVLLSFAGALMAALPLAGFVFLLFGEALMRGGTALGVGALLLAGAALLLHRARALFVEHLALVLLLLGLGLAAWGLAQWLPQRPGLLFACTLAIAVALALPPAWVRTLLGACAALLAHQGLDPGSTAGSGGRIAEAALLLAWAAGVGLQQAVLLGPDARHPGLQRRRLRAAARLDAVLAGWLLATLAAIALGSGHAMLVGASLPAPGLRPAGPGSADAIVALVLLTGTLAALLPRWPLLRAPAAVLLVAVVAALGLFMPGLALAAAAGLLAARTHRPGQAACAALAGAWVIGSFYYSLDWPLAVKALLLAAAGALLGAVLWLLRERGPARPRAPAPRVAGRRTAAVVLGVLATLLVVNVGILQKETLIAEGRPVWIELAPADPRSLMQGDYMALAYRLEPALAQALQQLPPTARPRAVARVDARGVARLERLAQPGEAPAAGELLVALKPGRGGWVVAADAWFFAEGEAARFEPARYGEFRLGADGEALLVGLADAGLRRLGSPAR